MGVGDALIVTRCNEKKQLENARSVVDKFIFKDNRNDREVATRLAAQEAMESGGEEMVPVNNCPKPLFIWCWTMIKVSMRSASWFYLNSP